MDRALGPYRLGRVSMAVARADVEVVGVVGYVPLVIESSWCALLLRRRFALRVWVRRWWSGCGSVADSG